MLLKLRKEFLSTLFSYSFNNHESIVGDWSISKNALRFLIDDMYILYQEWDDDIIIDVAGDGDGGLGPFSWQKYNDDLGWEKDGGLIVHVVA